MRSLECYTADTDSFYIQDGKDDGCVGALQPFANNSAVVAVAVFGGGEGCAVMVADRVEVFALARNGACFRVEDGKYWSAYAVHPDSYILHTDCDSGCINCQPNFERARTGQCVANTTLVDLVPEDCSDKTSRPAGYRLEPILIVAVSLEKGDR